MDPKQKPRIGSLALKVLLDSNIYKHDLTLDGGKFRLLFSQAAQGRFHLVLPEVVAREASELYRREIDAKLEVIEKAASRLESLQVSVANQELNDLEAKAAEFRKYLESKVLGDRGELVALSDISHSELIDKAIGKRRPFSGKGAGYRDALIWQNVVSTAASGQKLALVTSNHKDFAGTDHSKLHGDLIAELDEAGVSPDSVLLYPDLDSFLRAWVPEEEAALQQVKDLLGEEANFARFEDALASAIGDLVLPNEGQGILRGFEIHSEGAWIETLDKLKSVEATSAYSLDDKDASIELLAEVVVTVDFLAHKGDLYSAEQMYDLGDEIDPPFHIYDYDYNKSLGAAEAQMELSLTVQATFNAESRELDDLEITDIDQAPQWR